MKSQLLSILLLFFATTVTAQFQLEQLLGSPFPSDLIASQEEDKIAWVYNEKGKRNIWVSKDGLSLIHI